MTNKELIDQLSKFPLDKEVVINDADEDTELELTDVQDSLIFIILSGDYSHRIEDRKRNFK